MNIFRKSMGGDFDRLDVEAHGDRMTVTIRVGVDVSRDRITLRGEEAIRDLHYAIGRYLAQIDEQRQREANRA